MSYPHLSILGGGPAGLATGFYAGRAGIPFTLYEAGSRVGGNAATYDVGGFRFDSGAHRLHDKDRDVTRDLKDLLGDDLVHIQVPSQIYYRNRYIDFPLSPLDLLRKLGLWTSLLAGVDLLRARLGSQRPTNGTFAAFADYRYGHRLASMFLLNYSEKLWGLPPERLSPTISGARLKHLSLTTFLKEALDGKAAKTEHLDGSFYYPQHGYGMIAESLARASGEANIQLGQRITQIYHEQGLIRAIEINSESVVPVQDVVSTLPMPLFIRLMNPQPPREIVDQAKRLRFRNVALVAVFIDKERISANGSIYFPDKDFPFTRVYEPKNRSARMAPEGKTSLCAEIPCNADSDLWRMEDDALLAMVVGQFEKLGWLQAGDVIGGKVIRMPHAYPMLEAGIEVTMERLYAYLQGFENLRLTGRNGQFEYIHVHDVMRCARDLIHEYVQRAPLLAELTPDLALS